MNVTMILDAIYWLVGVVAGGFLAYGGWLCLIQHFTVDRPRVRTSETPAASDNSHVIHPS